MKNITAFFGQLQEYKPNDSYIRVTESQEEFAKDILMIFVNNLNSGNLDDIKIDHYGQLIPYTRHGGYNPIEDPKNKLDCFYELMNNSSVLKGGIFKPLFVKI
uniref:COesterase domain-containing protein n=1 Tax=Meloidogyne hapla TaxID=6305 RepID=A0A1I8BQ45_MELHA